MQGIAQKNQKSKIKNQKSKVGAGDPFWQFLPLRLRSVQAFALCLLPFALSCPSLAWAQSSALSLEEGTFLVFHPVFVHFAIALLLFGFVIDWCGSMLEQTQTQSTGRFCFLAGVLALGLAVMTGWIEQTLPRPVSVFDAQMQTTLVRHEYLGYGLFAFFLVLAIARMRIQGRLPALFVLLGAFGSLGLLFQGYLGGELVYRYGAGVRAVQVLSVPPAASEQKKAPE